MESLRGCRRLINEMPGKNVCVHVCVHVGVCITFRVHEPTSPLTFLLICLNHSVNFSCVCSHWAGKGLQASVSWPAYPGLLSNECFLSSAERRGNTGLWSFTASHKHQKTLLKASCWHTVITKNWEKNFNRMIFWLPSPIVPLIPKSLISHTSWWSWCNSCLCRNAWRS